MGFNSQIERSIARLAHSKEMSLEEKEIYLSPQMKSYLDGLATTYLNQRFGTKKTGKTIEVIIVDADPDEFCAYTDGNTIYINCNCEEITRYVEPEDRFIALMGMFYHELSHIMFCDFDEAARANESIRNGNLYGAEPEELSGEELDALDEIGEALKNPDFRPVFAKVFHDLDNILADRHDEDCIMAEYGGLCTAGIMKVRESLFNQFEIFDAEEAAVAEGKKDKLAVFYNTLLEYSRFDTLSVVDTDLWDTSDILQSIKRASRFIEHATWTNDTKAKFSDCQGIMVAIWKYIKEELDEHEKQKSQNGQGQQNQQGQPQQGQGQQGQNQQGQEQQGNGSQNSTQPSKEAIQKVLAALQQGSDAVPMNPAPKGRSSSKAAIVARKEAAAGQQTLPQPKPVNPAAASAAAQDKGKKEAEAVLRTLKSEIAKSLAEEEMESVLASDLNARIATVDQNSTHKGIRVHSSRPLKTQNRDFYEDVISEVGPYSKRLQKSIEDALRDIKQGGIEKHRPYGKMLRIQDTYRPDGRFFAKKRLPQDLPDMAVSVLVDNSGSMAGDRIYSAMKAATLLYDFATGLDIPVSVAGHCARSDYGIDYVTYADYERANKADRYRICAMRAGGCNRDGCALEIAANLLAQRPEETKLLCIISDGQPNHTGYGGKAAADDIRSIVRRYRSKGVEIIAAAIGDDKDTIKEIYGDGFLDISDLAKFPRIMTNLVKKRILNYI